MKVSPTGFYEASLNLIRHVSDVDVSQITKIQMTSLDNRNGDPFDFLFRVADLECGENQ